MIILNNLRCASIDQDLEQYNSNNFQNDTYFGISELARCEPILSDEEFEYNNIDVKHPEIAVNQEGNAPGEKALESTNDVNFSEEVSQNNKIKEEKIAEEKKKKHLDSIEEVENLGSYMYVMIAPKEKKNSVFLFSNHTSFENSPNSQSPNREDFTNFDFPNNEY